MEPVDTNTITTQDKRSIGVSELNQRKQLTDELNEGRVQTLVTNGST